MLALRRFKVSDLKQMQLLLPHFKPSAFEWQFRS